MPLIPITLDPGHAKNYNKGVIDTYYESNRMYDLSLYLKNSLEKYGIFKVYTTKPQLDMCPTLYDRATVAIKNGSRVILSLHSNACSTPSVKGVEAMVSSFRNNDDFNNAMIACVTETFRNNGSPDTKNRGQVKKLNSSGTDYYGLIRHSVSRKGIQFPILMEHGFHTNVDECTLLNDTDFLRILADNEAKCLYSLLNQYYVSDETPIYYFYAKSSLNIRTYPSLDDKSLVVGVYNGGEQVPVISIDGEWARVLFHECMYYVKANYLVEANSSFSAVPTYDKVKNILPVDTSVSTPTENSASTTPAQTPSSSSTAVPISDVETLCYNFFIKDMDLNTAAACGILANIKAESDFNPTALGDSGTSFGLCQWHKTRWDSLKKFASDNGLNYKDATTQLKYFKSEIEAKYQSVLTTLKNVKNTADGAYAAAYAFCVNFEIPSNKEAVGNTRGNTAKNTFWTKYGIKNINTQYNNDDQTVGASDVNYIGTGSTTDNLNMRKGPGTNYTKIGLIPSGTLVKVYIDSVCKGTNWYRVDYENLTGYCSRDYIKIDSITFKKATVSTALNLRDQPSLKGKVIKVLTAGTVVYQTKVDSDPEWSFVVLSEDDLNKIKNGTYNDGLQFVCNKYLTMSAETTLAGNLEETMRSGKLPFGVGQVNCSVLNVRNGPGTNYTKIATINRGTAVAILGHNNGWTEIMYRGNLEYVAEQYINIITDVGEKLEGEIDKEILPYIKSLPELDAVTFFSKTLKGYLSSDYGERTHPITKKTSFHHGIDIAANGGTPIYSPIDGFCLTSAYDSGGFGNYLRILAVDGTYHYFAHMKSTGIPKPGDPVYAGEKIGLVGTTGSSTGNHLHYEIRVADGSRVNPNEYQFTKSLLVESDQA